MATVAIANIDEKIKYYKNAIINTGLEYISGLYLDDLKKADALLLPGGGDINPKYWGEEIDGSDEPDDELDELQFEILDYFVKGNKPVMGICRGHQLINVYFGGSLIQDIENRKNHVGIYREGQESLDNIHNIFCVDRENILYKKYGDILSVNSFHHQALNKLGEGIKVVAKSDDGIIEAIKHEYKNIVSYQFHPERMCYERYRTDAVDGKYIFEDFKRIIEGKEA